MGRDMKTHSIDWDRSMMPALFDELSRTMPLPLPLRVVKSDPGSQPGVWYDGTQVIADFAYSMPWGSVQLTVLQGYALALGFGKGVPRTREALADFHDAQLAVYFEVSKYDKSLAESFKAICIPQTMEYVKNIVEREKRVPEMN